VTVAVLSVASLALVGAWFARKRRRQEAQNKGVVGAGYIALGETALPSQHRPQPNPIASSSSAQAVILNTSNIAKYSVGQQVCGMGQSGSVSGTITSITPGESPFATSGRGQLTIQP
jgi:hypothetical protein